MMKTLIITLMLTIFAATACQAVTLSEGLTVTYTTPLTITDTQQWSMTQTLTTTSTGAFTNQSFSAMFGSTVNQTMGCATITANPATSMQIIITFPTTLAGNRGDTLTLVSGWTPIFRISEVSCAAAISGSNAANPVTTTSGTLYVAWGVNPATIASGGYLTGVRRSETYTGYGTVDGEYN
ncbi:hypothetical protein [Oryzomonas rubra]|uniref:Uncharacterized protein n=1 Tax=Oryzomonas rubra TaxID=2509454 RepID=A0A5A9X4U2_9BACT|nr:hypothetical protein [Oryzomonas rubra]KAA0888087.1 hypothetical protein ET418_16945 [Oryzomonas rubra]